MWQSSWWIVVQVVACLPIGMFLSLFYGSRPNLSNLNVFGCSAFCSLMLMWKDNTLKLSNKFLLHMVAFMIPTIWITQVMINLVSREICHWWKKNFLTFESVFSKTVISFQSPRNLWILKKTKSSRIEPLKAKFENEYSRTQETWLMQKYSDFKFKSRPLRGNPNTWRLSS